jgi:hypothetical protein
MKGRTSAFGHADGEGTKGACYRGIIAAQGTRRAMDQRPLACVNESLRAERSLLLLKRR